MTILINKQKLQSLIWYGFIGLMCFTMFLNIWNYQHIIQPYEHTDLCLQFTDFFDQSKTSYGCLYLQPTVAPMINGIILGGIVFGHIWSLNDKHHWIVLKNGSES